jgi:hypothetical protein
MSNVGMTTLVNVWCNLKLPSFSLIMLCRYFPSYFGPKRALTIFVTLENNGKLQFGKIVN